MIGRFDHELWNGVLEQGQGLSVGLAALASGVEEKRLRYYIKKGYIKHTKQGRFIVIQPNDLKDFLFSEQYSEIVKRLVERFRLAYIGPYIPDNLRDYHKFHRFLNEFTWLLKVYYLPKTKIKSNEFRLDTLLQYYILESVADSPKLKRELLAVHTHSKKTKKEAESAIKKVWYGELSYSHPYLSDRLNLGMKSIKENLEISSSRFIFPSWRIAQAYYSVYHSIRALCELTGVQYDRTEHSAPLRAFKNAKLSPASKILYCYPFSLHYSQKTKGKRLDFYIPKFKGHFNFAYSSHPRPPNDSYIKILTRVIDSLKNEWKSYTPKKQKLASFMLPDFLYDFRVWVNYIDIDNVVALKSKGYRSFLDNDLHTIVFFHAAFVELAAIAILGAERTLELMRDFYNDFIKSEPDLWRSESNWSAEDRFRIYESLGRLEGKTFSLEKPPIRNVIEFIQTNKSGKV